MAEENENRAYEDIIESLGGFGRYQVFALLWHCSLALVLSAQFSYLTFALAIPIEVNCSDMEAVCNKSVVFDSIVNTWNLDNRHGRLIIAATGAVQLFGYMVGSIFAGFLADKYGRKLAFFLNFVMMCITGLLTGFSLNVSMFMTLRFFNGCAVIGCTCTSFVWYVEFIPEAYRMIHYLVGYDSGMIWVALLAWLTRDWKTLSLWMHVPAVITLIGVLILKESPKWLFQKGQREEAVKVLQTIAWCNGHELDETLLNAEGLEPHKTLKLSYGDLFYSRKATAETLTLAFTWVTAALLTYGLLYNVSVFPGDLYGNFFLLCAAVSLFDIVTVILDLRFELFGRRLLIILSEGGLVVFMVIISVLYTITDKSEYVQYAITSFTIISLSFGVGRLWIVVEIYCAEIFPTLLRTMGYGFCSFAARIGAIASQPIFLLFYLWNPAPFIVFALLSGIDLMLTCLYMPETKGRPLPDLPEEKRALNYVEKTKYNQDDNSL